MSMMNNIVRMGLGLVFFVGPTQTASQILVNPLFDFELVSWGEKPEFIQSIFGLRWIPNRANQSFHNIGSGRDDVFPLSANMKESGTEYFVLFEFRNADSGLVALTMLASGLTGFIDVPDEFIEMVWESNLARFGEPTGGKWIPLIGESKEWNVGDVLIKMIRMSLPMSGILVKYVRQETRDDQQNEKSGRETGHGKKDSG